MCGGYTRLPLTSGEFKEEGKGWPVPPPPFLVFFLITKNEVYEQKVSVKRVLNLSQNAGYGHFRNSNFQKFVGEHAPRPP